MRLCIRGFLILEKGGSGGGSGYRGGVGVVWKTSNDEEMSVMTKQDQRSV